MSILNKRVIVFGDPCCGKSYLIWKFMNHQTEEVPTILTKEYTRDLVTNGQRLRLCLVDTGDPIGTDQRLPEEIFRCVYSRADLILLCFNIGLVDSLESICEFWMPTIKQYRAEKVIPYILVGLKKDLRCNKDLKNVPVTTEEGERIAEKIQASAYVECSALREDGVEEVFETVANVFLKPSKKPASKFSGFLKKIFGK